jgi:hypothetical protein
MKTALPLLFPFGNETTAGAAVDAPANGVQAPGSRLYQTELSIPIAAR